MKPSLLAAALVCLATPVAAEPSFDTFKDICIASRGDSGAAFAAADARGWKPIPKDKLASFPSFVEDGSAATVDGRLDGDIANPSTIRTGMLMGHADRLDKNLTIGADFCVVVAMGAQSEALKRDAAAFAKVPAMPIRVFKDPNTTAYAWRDAPEGRQAVSPAEADSDAVVGAKILAIYSNAGVAMIALFTPTK